jgi:predicted RNase H-like HicB family nuclease
MEHSYTVLFEPAEEDGYVAFCPALPGLVTEGDTYEEARARVKHLPALKPVKLALLI